ncbi:hypothetical protein SAMN05421753_115172 [Planctomicrobium piriforme]|uniref:Uncharacterized protein n=1 Tax=Planctomicrobium piriforme TaxID=1576369 RepID=A0A1I3NRR2_9PLAN|nr:hypothetical protein SAMN05421753_115172 [Planctomicrobium piriforme]
MTASSHSDKKSIAQSLYRGAGPGVRDKNQIMISIQFDMT